jgi:hypothetical protein
MALWPPQEIWTRLKEEDAQLRNGATVCHRACRSREAQVGSQARPRSITSIESRLNDSGFRLSDRSLFTSSAHHVN